MATGTERVHVVWSQGRHDCLDVSVSFYGYTQGDDDEALLPYVVDLRSKPSGSPTVPVLIVGDSGVGKSEFSRVLRGLPSRGSLDQWSAEQVMCGCIWCVFL